MEDYEKEQAKARIRPAGQSDGIVWHTIPSGPLTLKDFLREWVRFPQDTSTKETP